MGASLSGKLADPEFRHDRAVKAGRARTTLAHHVQQVIDRAPALPNDVVEELRQLLPSGTPDDREAS
jgi:hypothetical protein